MSLYKIAAMNVEEALAAVGRAQDCMDLIGKDEPVFGPLVSLLEEASITLKDWEANVATDRRARESVECGA